MAKFSQKKMGKEVGQAPVYAARAFEAMDAEKKRKSGAEVMSEMNISAGTISKRNNDKVKTDGIKIRGTGAATKGVKARGPMA